NYNRPRLPRSDFVQFAQTDSAVQQDTLGANGHPPIRSAQLRIRMPHLSSGAWITPATTDPYGARARRLRSLGGAPRDRRGDRPPQGFSPAIVPAGAERR